MRNTFKIETERLVLRCWAEAHIDPCVQLCADPVVMQYFPDVLTRDRTLKLIGMFRDCFEKHGVFYAPIELKASGEFIGFAGLDVHDEEALPIGGCVDIGWRLKRSAWGRGLLAKLLAPGFDSALKPLVTKRLLPSLFPAIFPRRRS